MYPLRVPLSPRERLVKTILDHLRIASLADGATVCNCKRRFRNDRTYAIHLEEMLSDALSETLEEARVDGQLTLLAAAMRYFGPSERGTTARSRTVYTGAQFAGWCREKAVALRRPGGLGKPPTTDRDLITRDQHRQNAHRGS